jgi:hypothetical protein
MYGYINTISYSGGEKHNLGILKTKEFRKAFGPQMYEGSGERI